MFPRTLAVALAFATSACAAITINTPSGVTSDGSFNLTWSGATSSDPVFSVELVHNTFNDAFALANNVNPVNGSLNVPVGSVPVGDGYTIEFVNVTDINQVFATSGDFSIGAAVSSSSSVTPSATGSNGTASRTGSAPGSTATAPISGSGSASGSASLSGSGSLAGFPTSAGTSASSGGSASVSAPSASNTSGALPLRVSAAAGLLAALACLFAL